jgi:hypothetical protein
MTFDRGATTVVGSSRTPSTTDSSSAGCCKQEIPMATATILDFSTPHVLRNAREYKAAVPEIELLLDADPLIA